MKSKFPFPKKEIKIEAPAGILNQWTYSFKDVVPIVPNGGFAGSSLIRGSRHPEDGQSWPFKRTIREQLVHSRQIIAQEALQLRSVAIL